MNHQADQASSERLEHFNAHRPYLFAVAYRLLGRAEDAEDVLQDAWLRYAAAGLREVESHRAYLTTIVTRLALDLLRSARVRREQYVGVWLPEPVPTTEALPEDLAEQRESASFAFLLLLERLNSVERAVLVLHDVFDYTHEEIARMTDRTPEASRQTLRRARTKLGPERPGTPHAVDEMQVQAMIDAIRNGDALRLTSMLAPDVVLLGDGGGKARTISRPLAGHELVARFLAGLRDQDPGFDICITSLNGQPAILAYLNGRIDTVMMLDLTPGGITAIYVQRNPDKLRRLTRTLQIGTAPG
jgi:RNA polymerase sigma-70 factor, ECF subfamily